MKSQLLLVPLAVSALMLGMAAQGMAQSGDGKVALHVTPKQAYVWVDGRAISEARKTPMPIEPATIANITRRMAS